MPWALGAQQLYQTVHVIDPVAILGKTKLFCFCAQLHLLSRAALGAMHSLPSRVAPLLPLSCSILPHLVPELSQTSSLFKHFGNQEKAFFYFSRETLPHSVFIDFIATLLVPLAAQAEGSLGWICSVQSHGSVKWCQTSGGSTKFSPKVKQSHFL